MDSINRLPHVGDQIYIKHVTPVAYVVDRDIRRQRVLVTIEGIGGTNWIRKDQVRQNITEEQRITQRDLRVVNRQSFRIAGAGKPGDAVIDGDGGVWTLTPPPASDFPEWIQRYKAAGFDWGSEKDNPWEELVGGIDGYEKTVLKDDVRAFYERMGLEVRVQVRVKP